VNSPSPIRKLIFCDPPSGWRYGFPRVIPDEVYSSKDENAFSEWLFSCGYPKEVYDLFSEGNFPCRYWEQEDS
jgi:hypothetical protein